MYICIYIYIYICICIYAHIHHPTNTISQKSATHHNTKNPRSVKRDIKKRPVLVLYIHILYIYIYICI